MSQVQSAVLERASCVMKLLESAQVTEVTLGIWRRLSKPNAQAEELGKKHKTRLSFYKVDHSIC